MNHSRDLALLTAPRIRLPGANSASITNPLPSIRAAAWNFSHPGRTRPVLRGVGGHAAVVRSIRRGLQQLGGRRASLDPLFLPPTGVLVGLGGRGTAHWVISQDAGSFKWLGPNAFVLPTEVLTRASIAHVHGLLVPSSWVGELYADDLPEAQDLIRVWAAGVDMNLWRPVRSADQRRRVVLYVKDIAFVEPSLVPALSASAHELSILHYGRHSQAQYRHALLEASALVYVGGSESQGIALLEAWASDVPTMVYSPRHAEIRLGDGSSRILDAGQFSPAPYLTDELGRTWSSVEELLDVLDSIVGHLAPRDVLGDEWSDKARTAHLLEILGASV